MADGTTIPRALAKGDTIALVSPSTRLNEVLPAALHRSQQHLESLGFHTKVFYSPLHGTHMDQVQQRVKELHEAFADQDVKAILCTSGGNHASELMRHLDYRLIRANPKIFCGYSDITTLHNALFTHARLRTFYGPTCLQELGTFPAPIDFTTNHLLRVMCDAPGEPLGAFPRSEEYAKELPSFITGDDEATEDAQVLSPSPDWQWLRAGKGTGRIRGGVLTSLLETAGTKFWPDFKGAILLLESSFGNKLGEPVPLAKTRSQLAQLANMGILDQVNGLVFGRLVGQSKELDARLGKVLLDQCHGTDFPILINVDFGHTDPKLTIPLGSLVRMDSENDEFAGLEPGVVE